MNTNIKQQLELEDVVLLGRTFAEYNEFFSLQQLDLSHTKTLDLCSGRSSSTTHSTSEAFLSFRALLRGKCGSIRWPISERSGRSIWSNRGRCVLPAAYARQRGAWCGSAQVRPGLVPHIAPLPRSLCASPSTGALAPASRRGPPGWCCMMYGTSPALQVLWVVAECRMVWERRHLACRAPGRARCPCSRIHYHSRLGHYPSYLCR
jgi:hypothetical protein